MGNTNYLLYTMADDTKSPQDTFVGEIVSIDSRNSELKCIETTSGIEITFQFLVNSGEPWQGADDKGNNFVINTHDIYSPGAIDPVNDSVALITFTDNNSYLCYVENISPNINIIFYQPPYNRMSIDFDTIISSDWDRYSINTKISSIQGCTLSNDVLKANETESTPTQPASDETHTQYLFVDVYSLDLNGNPDWNVLVNTPRFNGVILKATQGAKGYFNDKGWFNKNWPLVKSVGGDKYGSTWFRGAYIFLNLWSDGASQADNYLKVIEDAGGWDSGDIYPIIDVELGNDGLKKGKRNPNQDVSSQQIIDCATACANRLKSVIGRKVILYGRGAMRDRSIKNKMGCDCVWNPSYTSTIVMHGLEAWTIDDVVLWQYCGDGVAGIDESKLPRFIPNFGKVDISVYIEGKNKPTIETLRQRLGIGS